MTLVCLNLLGATVNSDDLLSKLSFAQNHLEYAQRNRFTTLR